MLARREGSGGGGFADEAAVDRIMDTVDRAMEYQARAEGRTAQGTECGSIAD